jgi:predicted transglutaminase-like cysteine proteinase
MGKRLFASLVMPCLAMCGIGSANAVAVSTIERSALEGQPDSCSVVAERGQIDTNAAVLALPSFQKSSALLGGVSQLELISQQQAASAELAYSAPTPGPAVNVFSSSLPVPASIGPDCAGLVASRAKGQTLSGVTNGDVFTSGDFLLSKRLPVKRTGLDDQWRRVRAGVLPREARTQVARISRLAQGEVSELALQQVTSWANQRIRYAEDRDLYGRPDYWATAQSTIRRGAGDCEDIAIVKMQMLAALGVARDDMYLTVARDLVRSVDHALLIVRVGEKHWILDNGTDQVVDANATYDYRPIMSFSSGRKWLHGYSAKSRLALN